jgi:rhodanese-related sulfurtransferase
LLRRGLWYSLKSDQSRQISGDKSKLMNKFLIFLFLGIALALSACGGSAPGATGSAPSATAARITNLSVSEAFDLMQKNRTRTDFSIVDVRTPAEYQSGHIEGAVNIDIYAADFEARLKGLERNSSYLVYCRSGARSAQASQTMFNLGFVHVFNMLDGISGWTAAGYPVTQ